MSILIDERTRIGVQGITSASAQNHLNSMLGFGSNVVAGISPSASRSDVAGVPVYPTMRAAINDVGQIDLSIIFVGRSSVVDAIIEAGDAGVKTVVCMEEFVPVHDAALAVAYLRSRGSRLIGPNTNGLASMGKAAAGFFPVEFNMPGRVGVVSRSGTLSYGAVAAMQRSGIGQSTVVGVGGSVLRGLNFADCLALFAADSRTDVVVLLGEIGGQDEHAAAAYIASGLSKPVVALLVGRGAPPGVVMGHAGAIVTDESEGWSAKARALSAAGATVVASLDDLADCVSRLVSQIHPAQTKA